MIPKNIATTSLSDHYTLLEDPDDEKQWLVKVLKGPWAGVIYRYNKLKLVEDKAADKLICQFEYDIIEVPANLAGKDLPDQTKGLFEKFLGDIVVDILETKESP